MQYLQKLGFLMEEGLGTPRLRWPLATALCALVFGVFAPLKEMNVDTFCQHWKEPDCAFRGERWAWLSTDTEPANTTLPRARYGEHRERCKAQTCSQQAQQFCFSEKEICFKSRSRQDV